MKKLEELGISPAPWTASQTGLILKKDVCPRDNGDLVAVCCGCYEIDSNARLIAAAPDLYEQLRDAVNDQCHDCDHRDDDFNCHNGCYCKIWKWRAALAKAAGEEAWK